MASIKFNRFIKDKIDDLGLSSQVNANEERSINKDGSFNVIRKGEEIHMYHWLISMSWAKFLALIFIVFTLLNGTFALIYYFVGLEYIVGIQEEGFIMDIVNAFHFSVQTMTTIGYGALYPHGLVTNVIASVEALIGLLSFGLITGLIYGRFSNPNAKIAYSKNMIITPHGEQMALQARIANKLSHDLYGVEARILFIHNDVNVGGAAVKRYKEIKLQIDSINFMPLNWTLNHIIDENSPLYNKSLSDLKELQAEFLVLITAFDDSFSQVVHSRSSYIYNEIIENAIWEVPFEISKTGKRVFDINKIDNYTLIRNEEKSTAG